MKIIQTIFLGIILAISSSAFADYKSLGLNAQGSEIFYDPDSIVRDRNAVRVWIYINFKEQVEEAKSIRALRKIDCKNRTTENLDVAIFPKLDIEGKYLDSWQPKPETTYIAPDTMDDVLLQTVCLK